MDITIDFGVNGQHLFSLAGWAFSYELVKCCLCVCVSGCWPVIVCYYNTINISTDDPFTSFRSVQFVFNLFCLILGTSNLFYQTDFSVIVWLIHVVLLLLEICFSRDATFHCVKHLWVMNESTLDPNSNSAEIFLNITPTPKLHHLTFTRLEVIVLTNKQTDAAENIQRSSLCYDVG